MSAFFYRGNRIQMSSELSGQTAANLFELKSSSLTVPVLRLFGTDMESVAAGLAEKSKQTPDFFHNAPIVIDLSGLGASSLEVNLPLLIGLIRGMGMLPVGVQGGSPEQHAAAELLELAVLGGRPVTGRQPSRPTAAAAPAGSTLVTRPIRSGQRVYARGGDLIVTAAVSSGAELFADGNIHVYGALRGRAMAGIRGNSEARIFCQALEADLVAIAGRYQVNEDMQAECLGCSVQVFLQQGRLVMAPI